MVVSTYRPQDAYQKVRNIKDEAEKTTAMDKWFAEEPREDVGYGRAIKPPS